MSTTPVIGASGAIAGVLGAFAVTWPWARVSTLIFLVIFVTVVEVPALVVLGAWFLLQVWAGQESLRQASAGGVAWWAHVGGFRPAWRSCRSWAWEGERREKRQTRGMGGRLMCDDVYAELHAKTNFSFLEGASHPDELVPRAAELGYGALAVTDRNSLAGIVRAHGAAKDAGLKLIVGAEITPEDAPPVVALGPRSRRLRPAGSADHPRPPPRRKRPMPALAGRHRRTCRGLLAGGDCKSRERGEGTGEAQREI